MRFPWKTSISRLRARNWITFAWLLAGYLCVARTGHADGLADASLEGQRVSEIRIVDEHGAGVTVKSPALAIAVGKTFDFSDERESLRTLYRTGDFADIRVAAAPAAEGVRIDFIVRRNYFNNVVRIEGLKEPPTEPAAIAALRLGLGEPFRDSALRSAIDRLQDLLRTEGLYGAKITWNLGPHEDTRQMDITVYIDPGVRALVGNIAVKNETRYTDAELIQRSKITPKNQLTSARLTRASTRIKKYLVNQGFLGAGVVFTPGTYDAAANRVPLNLEVTTGPHVRVELTGGKVSTGRLRKLLPIYAEGAVDEDLLQEGRRNIRDFFQREGYFDADVQVASRQDVKSGDRVITYDVNRGSKFRLAAVAFDGNKYFSRELLSGRLQLQTASFAASGRFSQSLVRADVDSIKSLYLSNGYRDAQVTTTIDDRYHDKKGNLFVAFHIEEGPQTLVSSLEVEGNHALSTATILAVSDSTPGQPFSEAGVASDRNNILAMYYNEGYPEAHFNDEVSPGQDPNRVRVIFHITEGTRIDVAKVLLTGYQYTRPGLIARQVKIVPGPLREGDMVETQRRLYNLGVFSRVTIAPQNPNGTDPEKAMVVDAEEGKRYTFAYGGGFEVQRLAGGSSNPSGTIVGASPRGILELSRNNMFGRAQTLSFKVRASTLQYRAVISYVADNLFAYRKLSLQLTGFADKTQDINTFTSVRYEAAFNVVHSVSPSTTLAYRYFFRRVTASNLNIQPEEIPLLSQPTLVSGFGFTYARDRRDNPADAKHGSFNTIDASVALKSLGSEASFFRGSFQNSTFTSFGRAFVFARSVRFGVEQTIGDTEEMDVPLPERFFAGGGTSIRGFSLNQAGPRDPVTGFPIGGLALLAFNQELRFPMRLPWIGNRLGGTIFYDAGNVYTDINHISFAWKPPANDNNLPYFSHTIGFGVRYPTPVGPVRVDFGYQLNPPKYAGEDLFPPPRPPIPREFSLPHFQFFFNIGPVF
ncbi:MAG TPA: POTRA domain-containing protein [Candidatus Acidoferrales bacterium]|nr:POTRA domain-containing protein [Candidatus Acidoferrales bacterium]